MNRKTVGILSIALVAMLTMTYAVSMTWTSSKISMTAGSASIISLGIYEDCDTTIPFCSHDWNGVVQDQVYEVTVYVRNTGTEAVYLTYLPTDLSFDHDQTRMTTRVYIIEGPATPCQLNPVDRIPLPEKIPTYCDQGFLLTPGKVVKLDIELFVHSLVAGGTWAWDFFIYGCAP